MWKGQGKTQKSRSEHDLQMLVSHLGGARPSYVCRHITTIHYRYMYFKPSKIGVIRQLAIGHHLVVELRSMVIVT